MLPSMRWHFLSTPAADGARNMALDEALMRRAARTGDAVFRVYGWSAPTLSLGRNQRARGAYDEPVARSLGVGFVRRPTGGRALLHHHEVTYSVTMPLADSRQARAAYAFINQLLLDGLTRLGVPARMATATASIPPGLRPCFDVPAEHEIVVGNRKLVGSAQWCRGGALLQHGSILVRDDQPIIARLMKGEIFAEPPAAATLAEALGWEPPVERVGEALLAAVTERVGSVDPLDARDAETDAEALQRVYTDASWTWRR
jgi:lipoyl(octanoyl) transferase